jgi:hypothetical protein
MLPLALIVPTVTGGWIAEMQVSTESVQARRRSMSVHAVTCHKYRALLSAGFVRNTKKVGIVEIGSSGDDR